MADNPSGLNEKLHADMRKDLKNAFQNDLKDWLDDSYARLTENYISNLIVEDKARGIPLPEIKDRIYRIFGRILTEDAIRMRLARRKK